MKMKIYYYIIKRMPKKLKYLIAIDVVAYATTGKYGDTEVPKITAMDAIKRFEDDHDII